MTPGPGGLGAELLELPGEAAHPEEVLAEGGQTLGGEAGEAEAGRRLEPEAAGVRREAGGGDGGQQVAEVQHQLLPRYRHQPHLPHARVHQAQPVHHCKQMCKQ